MPEFELTTRLEAPAERIWQELQKPALLEHVAAGRLRSVPVEPPALPEHWQDGDYRVALRGFGWLPLVKHFFRHRQRRWRRLVDNGFDYSDA